MLDQLIPISYHLASFFRRIDGADEKPNITEREMLCLQWTACGKTAWEFAGILGITERTANFHLGNAMAKLGAATKIHAVTKAIRLGIIKLH